MKSLALSAASLVAILTWIGVAPTSQGPSSRSESSAPKIEIERLTQYAHRVHTGRFGFVDQVHSTRPLIANHARTFDRAKTTSALRSVFDAFPEAFGLT